MLCLGIIGFWHPFTPSSKLLCRLCPSFSSHLSPPSLLLFLPRYVVFLPFIPLHCLSVPFLSKWTVHQAFKVHVCTRWRSCVSLCVPDLLRLKRGLLIVTSGKKQMLEALMDYSCRRTLSSLLASSMQGQLRTELRIPFGNLCMHCFAWLTITLWELYGGCTLPSVVHKLFN